MRTHTVPALTALGGQLLRLVVPAALRRPLRAWWHRPTHVRWGNLRRLTPVSRVFGLDRGTPIDRVYIEAFLARHGADIAGRVLEFGDPGYTRRFGGARVTHSDVLHRTADNPQATLVGDLRTGEGVPVGAFDCILCTQTLQFLDEVAAGVATLHAALKPGGVLLATVPGISQISRYDMERWGDYWRFTPASAAQCVGAVFGADQVQVQSHGNVLVACAFLHGLAAEELTRAELDAQDPEYPLLITLRAVKRGGD